MAENKDDIVRRLIEIRMESGLLSKDFALKSNIDPKNYSSIENKKRTIGDRVIQDICKSFNINAVWLKTGLGEKYATKSQNAAVPTDSVLIPREVFDQISRLTETVLSQQRSIEMLSNLQKGGAAGVKGAARKEAIG